jgi:hypothetical protein
VCCVIALVGFYISFRVCYYWGCVCYFKVFSYFNLSVLLVCGKFIYFMSVCCIYLMVFFGNVVIAFYCSVDGLVVFVLG